MSNTRKINQGLGVKSAGEAYEKALKGLKASIDVYKANNISEMAGLDNLNNSEGVGMVFLRELDVLYRHLENRPKSVVALKECVKTITVVNRFICSLIADPQRIHPELAAFDAHATRLEGDIGKNPITKSMRTMSAIAVKFVSEPSLTFPELVLLPVEPSKHNTALRRADPKDFGQAANKRLT